MNRHSTHRRDAVEDEGNVVPFTHFSDGFSVLGDAAAGFVVANEQRFIAATFKLLFQLIEVKGASPIVFELLHITELSANVGHPLSEFSIRGNEHEVVVAKPVGDDHFHGRCTAARNDDHTVPVFSSP